MNNEHKIIDGSSAPQEKAYSARISRKTLADMRKGIHNYVVIAKRYRDMNYSARKLAVDLGTNTRYVSAAISLHYGCNYTSLVNKLRIEDAKQMLENSDCMLTMDEVAHSVGFSTRQSFYTAFDRYVGTSPRAYKEKFAASKEASE